MSEINQRWQRDHRNIQKLTGAGVALGATLWAISYFAATVGSWAASATFVEGWFGFAALAAFVGALGVTIVSVIGVSILLTDTAPLEGSNC